MTTTWCVWMRTPSTANGWSRVAGELSEADARWLSDALYFDSRAMPDREETRPEVDDADRA